MLYMISLQHTYKDGCVFLCVIVSSKINIKSISNWEESSDYSKPQQRSICTEDDILGSRIIEFLHQYLQSSRRQQAENCYREQYLPICLPAGNLHCINIISLFFIMRSYHIYFLLFTAFYYLALRNGDATKLSVQN